MSAFRGRARPQGVLLLACCTLFLRQCESLREPHREHAAQQRQLMLGRLGRTSRGLREVFEDDYDEDQELDLPPKLGTGISRLGIHGEGLGYVSHSLLESDSELIALAAAVKSGNAKATGRGPESSGSSDAEGDEADFGEEEDSEIVDDEDSEEAAQAAPDQEQVLEAAGPGQEQVLQAAGLIDGEEKGVPAGEGGGTEEGAGAEASAQAKALEERNRNARPPWFSQRTLTADAVRKEVVKARLKAGRRQRHHSTVEDTWLTCHRQFVKELDEWDKQGGWDVLFYGDSIVEEWRGTFLGAPWGPFHDVRKVWDEYFGRKAYRAHSMGIASDGVEQLLWRIQHGEVPGQGQHHPKVVVVHVGTNDIAGDCSVETAEKVAGQMEKLLEEMHRRLPNTHIIVMAILPKGEVWPNRCSEAIDGANSRIADVCEGPPHLHYIDVGQAFLSETLEGNRYEIKETLMPDSMHPSAVGMRIIATRLEPLVSQLFATASRLPQTSR